MLIAIGEARAAAAAGEIPVGAVIVRDGDVIAQGHNLCETKKNALYHAEIAVISKACEKLETQRLSDCDIYVTLEPCAMCCGAIARARIRRLYFGAYDPRGGFAVSNGELLTNPAIMHKTECYCGIMEEECSSLLNSFFGRLRDNK